MARPLQASRSASNNRSLLRSMLRMFTNNSQALGARQKPVGYLEQLEDRRLLSGYGTQYGPARVSPNILQTGYFIDEAAYNRVAAAVADYQGYVDNYGGPSYPPGYPGNGPGPGNGEGLDTPIVVTEAEPNNRSGSGQLVPLNTLIAGQNVALMKGTIANTDANTFDVDYYSLNLRAGDILDISLFTQTGGNLNVELQDSQGRLLVTSFGPIPQATLLPASSPLTTTGQLAFAQVIATDGIYQIRVEGASTDYEVTGKVFRNAIEQQPIGTVPELFLDFDGANVSRAEFDETGALTGDTARMESMADGLRPYGFSDADINKIIDGIIAAVNEDYNGSVNILGNNGHYFTDGGPGNFSLRITNSRDHGDRWGLPNVSRIVIGGSAVDFFERPGFNGVLGIASTIDVGNFDLEETVLAFSADWFDLGFIQNTPLGPDFSQLDAFVRGTATVISHELGHSIGLWHTNPFNNIQTIMDPFVNMGEGPDGLLGTEDDIDVDFVPDQYRIASPALPQLPGEYLYGFEQEGVTVSHNLASGTRGIRLTGSVFNDFNVSGTRQGAEFGMPGQVVYADANGNSVLDPGETRTLTAADGSFSFVAPAGNYFVRTIATGEFRLSSPGVAINASLDQTVNGINLGQYLPNEPVTGYKWLDLNSDGVRDPNEPGIGGVYIYADLNNDNKPDISEPATLTFADGSYVLVGLPTTGVFSIREVLGPGYVQVYPTNTEREHVITPATQRPLRNINFGNKVSRDYGDLPLPFRTTDANGGASHGIVAGFSLGTLVDAETTGTPSVDARGDDTTGVDDEDGVKLAAPLVVGATDNKLQINVTNTINLAGYIQGWMDFNGDGDFNDAGEHIIDDRVADTGVYTFSIPATAVLGNVLARFRLSGQQGVGPDGAAFVGEVEDYQFQLLSELRYTNPDAYKAARNSALTDNVIDVLANDPIKSIEGFTAAISSVSQGTRGGTVTTNGSTVSYRPAPGFVGTEIFRYTILVSNGVVATETVTVTVDFFFPTPRAVDNSFDVSLNAKNVELDVLANDAEGQGGALSIQSVSATNSGGTAVRSANGQRIIYTPATSFEGTETFTYTLVDGKGATSTASVTVHVLPGDRDNDDVEFSLIYRNLNGVVINQVVQGQSFLVDVMVRDLRPSPNLNPGVFAAYLDLLYNSDLVLPAPPAGGSFDFNVQFADPFTQLQDGDSVLPGLINELGATGSNANDRVGPVRLATLRFDARTAGIATFFPDPADETPKNDVVMNNNSAQPVPEIRTRYLRSSIEVIANPSEFPQAVDDSPIDSVPINTPRVFDVLANDVVGMNGPITITRVTQPASGSVAIERVGGVDMVRFTSGATTGTQTFTYTVIDALGFESTARVTVQVGNITADDQIQLRLEVTDLAGNPITQIGVNQQFQLRGYVDDLRTNAGDPGVFAAFQDILLSDATLASINLANNPRGFAVQFSTNYGDGSSGDIRVPGLINEIGSQQSAPASSSLGDGEFLQFIVTLTARSAGALTFIGDPADLVPNSDSLLYDTLAPVDISRIRYTDTTITIVGGGGGTGAGEGFTNQVNALDVNNDGYVSSIDVLAIINRINAGGRGPLAELSGEGESVAKRYYYDTNADGQLSSLDILKLFNYLNARSRGLAGEGESASNSNDKALASNDTSGLDSVLDAVAIDVDAIKKGGTRI